MSNTNRRVFLMTVAAGTSALSAAQSFAQAGGPQVLETDPQAIALGYKNDSTKVDAKKYPKHAATQSCLSCQLFQPKGKDVLGGCPLFAGKQVSAKGWCSAWTQKA